MNIRTTVFHVLLLGTLGAFMLFISWQRWAEPIVDFGRELYVPWRLTEGDVLYRDLAYFNGPLSPYLNALAFMLFGAGIRTLIFVNLGFTLLALWLIYRLFMRLGDQTAALAASAVFLGMFAFSEYLHLGGNHNFITPYSHEMTHGLILSLGAFHVFRSYANHPTTPRILLLGALVGLVALTKMEIAIALAIIGGILFVTAQARERFAKALRRFLLGAAACSFPILAALLLLQRAMPLKNAANALLLPYREVFIERAVERQPFYLEVSGFAEPSKSLSIIMRASMVYLSVAFGGFLILWVTARMTGRYRRMAAVTLCFIAGAVTFFALNRYGAGGVVARALRPLPFVAAGTIIMLGIRLPRSKIEKQEEQKEHARRVTLWAFALFSFLTLLKIILKVRAVHYGFILALPGALLLTFLLVSFIPRLAEARWRNGGLARTLGLTLIAIVIFFHVRVARHIYATRIYPISNGIETVLNYDSPQNRAIGTGIAYLARTLTPKDTLVVMPEGVTINYLLRRRNSTPYTNFRPAELALFGETRMLSALEEHPPDYVVFIPKLMPYFGDTFFGKNTAERIYAWVTEQYETVEIIGKGTPDERHGPIIMKRKPS